jgi:hypothetical protein
MKRTQAIGWLTDHPMELQPDILFVLQEVKKYLEEVLAAEKESRGAKRDQWYGISP